VILSVRIMTDKASGRSKGYGFVSYETAESAAGAIQHINGKQALGKRLKVELKKGGISQAMNFDQDNAMAASDSDSVVQQILGKDDAAASLTNMIYEGTTGANSVR
jgi:CUG-BP- and ETR3-like factor